MILIALPANAQSWRKSIHAELPAQVQKIILNKTSISEAQTLLGKPDLVEKNKSYWAIDQFKYSLQLTFKNDKVQKLHFTFTKQRPDLQKYLKFLDLKKMRPFPKMPKRVGKYLEEKNQNGRLIVDPVEGVVMEVELE